MKFLLPLVLLSASALATTANEDAIILNQELQFLEDSAKGIRVEREVAKTEEKEKSTEESSLERTYFRDAERDEIRTKAAGPKRNRSF
jgi:hypothetical protein